MVLVSNSLGDFLRKTIGSELEWFEVTIICLVSGDSPDSLNSGTRLFPDVRGPEALPVFAHGILRCEFALLFARQVIQNRSIWPLEPGRRGGFHGTAS